MRILDCTKSNLIPSVLTHKRINSKKFKPTIVCEELSAGDQVKPFFQYKGIMEGYKVEYFVEEILEERFSKPYGCNHYTIILKPSFSKF